MSGFRFGSDSIDRLMNPKGPYVGTYGNIASPEVGSSQILCEPFVGCIVGPDGVGKSILSLQAAATYRADSLYRHRHGDIPHVLYFSTDFAYSQARMAWQSFYLNTPITRAQLLRDASVSFVSPSTLDLASKSPYPSRPESEIELIQLRPFPTEPQFYSTLGSSGAVSPIASTADLFDRRRWERSVSFIDLVANPSGDDWTTINRLVGQLADITSLQPHLIVIDAIEGLEALIGEHDAFGMARSRRSRLAQLIRLAKRVNATLLLVVEEVVTSERLPELFVSDLVVRLRSVEDSTYLKRTIEVEKARGIGHIRGQHDLVIRSGNGTCTLNVWNVDDPRIFSAHNRANAPMSYFLALPSLHLLKESVPSLTNAEAGRGQDPQDGAIFGIADLDLQLGLGQNAKDPARRMIVLVGDSGTNKSALGRAFLGKGVEKVNGGCLLLTTDAMNPEFWNNCLLDLTAVYSPASSPTDLRDRIRVRHLPPWRMSSAGFFHILEANVSSMKARLGITSHQDSYRLRVVIDDWNVLLESHPNLAGDSILLQRLFWFLQEQGVFTLLISTQAGRPSIAKENALPNNVIDLDVRNQIYTWPVPFFGGQRVAITTFPPMSSVRPSSIYELRASSVGNRQAFQSHFLEVDRHFTLYSGLEEAHPQRIPLRVRLYSGFHSAQEPAVGGSYTKYVRSLFSDLFHHSDPADDVLQLKHMEDYEAFKEFVQTLDTSRLDYSFVFQVDEFWSSKKVFADLSDYWNASTAHFHGKWLQDLDEDPDLEYQPAENSKDTLMLPDHVFGVNRSIQKAWRGAFFCSPWDRDTRTGRVAPDEILNKVPLHADFGFLLANRPLWWAAREKSIWTIYGELSEGQTDDWYSYFARIGPDVSTGGTAAPGTAIRVGDVWNALCIEGSEFRDGDDLYNLFPKGTSPSWESFFEACRVVRGLQSVPAFDVDLRTTETLNSLVLEVWFSLLHHIASFGRMHSRPFLELERFLNTIQDESLIIRRDQENSGWDLRMLVEKWYPALYISLELLDSVLPKFEFTGLRLKPRPADTKSVALRTWYAPGCLLQKENPDLVPLRNPGRYSTRGDWYLTYASGSRSSLLAWRAIDKLTTRRMNLRRLQEGAGLPRRSFTSSVKENARDSEWIELASIAHPIGNLKTAISTLDPLTMRLEYVPLHSLLRLGSVPIDEVARDYRIVHWLWRSRIDDYDRNSSQFLGFLTRHFDVLQRMREGGEAPLLDEDTSDFVRFLIPIPNTFVPTDIRADVEPIGDDERFHNAAHEFVIAKLGGSGAERVECFLNHVRTFCALAGGRDSNKWLEMIRMFHERRSAIKAAQKARQQGLPT